MKCIYIHIPFCDRICSYCDFIKIHYNKELVIKYLTNLEKEIKLRYKNELIDTIYLGGGTPSSLDCDELEKLFSIINIFNKKKRIEYTMECNVESLTKEKISLMKKYGINRVSLGVQSFDKNILNILGRKHTKEDVKGIIELLKEENINNISIDLMYAVNDDIDIIKNDLKYFLDLDIPHISYYSLILENHTILYNSQYHYIDTDKDYEMYQYIEKTLESNNYIHYEVSNYAKRNYESIHNLNYWNNGEYYGFGLGAVSYINYKRMTNTKNITKYIEGNYLSNEEFEDINLRQETDIILGLRKLEGINLNDFYDKYNKRVEELFDIRWLLEDKKIIIDNNFLKINKDFFYLENEILLYFIKGDN